MINKFLLKKHVRATVCLYLSLGLASGLNACRETPEAPPQFTEAQTEAALNWPYKTQAEKRAATAKLSAPKTVAAKTQIGHKEEPSQLVKPQHTRPEAPLESAAQTAPQPRAVTPFKAQRCMNVGNSMESAVEGAWGTILRESDFQKISAAGFDSIRLPVRWDTHMKTRAPYTVDPAYMRRVETLVTQAMNNNLAVVLDVHLYDKLSDSPESEEQRYYHLWMQIARHFAQAPDTLYFELFNEPTNAISHDWVNRLYAEGIPLSRESNPERIIIMGGNQWNSPDSLWELDFPDDPNIVATYHDYGPFDFTHQGAEWISPRMPMGRKWGSAQDIKVMQSEFKRVRAFKQKSGLRLFSGEFGVINKVPIQQRNTWAKARRKTMEREGISWCAWNYTGAYNLIDETTGQWLPGVLEALFD